MAKRAIIEDETGKGWLVIPGDPAWHHVAALKKLGFEYTVLHHETITTGELRSPLPVGMLQDLAVSVSKVDSQGVRDAFNRQVRLHTCLRALGR